MGKGVRKCEKGEGGGSCKSDNTLFPPSVETERKKAGWAAIIKGVKKKVIFCFV